ncbi:hypothetical protein [Candidatus Uabimicrobium amorphum]|uniref:Uncharacterized protein n=1 Tax=Uabimicrobium amorphum TaxID=2596890 RepID=A0A5S9IQP7_UABAM|nr:hypothetical protein [Candidatus Uabimicrobium amorphum]BBM85410.1 hypothetical protein UABAM_03777 [Candidatus Uabimicrobium amorphum]
MKYIILLSLAFVMAVCPFAAEEKFEVVLDAKGSNTDNSDFGWSILLVDGSVDQDCAVKLFSARTREVFFEGKVQAGERFPINVKTSEMSLTITDGVAGSTVNCTVQWKLGKFDELFSLSMHTNKAGAAHYSRAVIAEKDASIRVNNIMASHNCVIKIKLDNAACFRQEVRAGEIYTVDGISQSNMKVSVAKGPKNQTVHLSLDVDMVGNATFQSRNSVNALSASSNWSIINDSNAYRVEFDQTTDDTGCVHSDSYNVSPKGYHPQIKLLIVNQKFKDIVLKVNGITLRPEFGISFNGQHFYRVGFGLKSGEELELGLVAEGGKPMHSTNFAFVCENFDEQE